MQILHILPFDADRKRMSVIVRETFNQSRLILFTKGADATVLPVLSQGEKREREGEGEGDETEVIAEWSESEDGTKTINKAQEHLSE